MIPGIVSKISESTIQVVGQDQKISPKTDLVHLLGVGVSIYFIYPPFGNKQGCMIILHAVQGTIGSGSITLNSATLGSNIYQGAVINAQGSITMVWSVRLQGWLIMSGQQAAG